MLVNGEPQLTISARRGEVIRLYITNTANTRVFNFAIRNARMKLVGSEEPGKCPKCAMKLMPMSRAAGEGAPQEDHPAPRVHADGEEHGHAAGAIEWEDDMVEVNKGTTPANTRWKLIDRETGAAGQEIGWRFTVGDQVKIRLVNEMESDHPMHHPFHIHGAGRFLVLARDGALEANLVWTDTILITPGQEMDLLLDVTHPGVWLAHCHIAEHHESGMMLAFEVEPRTGS